MSAARCCPTCGARTVEYRHRLTPGLVQALGQFSAHPKALAGVHLSECGFTRTQWDNFQKLKYWGLVVPEGRGRWSLTFVGHDFVAGRMSLPVEVVTYRGELQRYAGRRVRMVQVDGQTWQREFTA